MEWFWERLKSGWGRARTNAICMILHVLTRALAHPAGFQLSVYVFCLLFWLQAGFEIEGGWWWSTGKGFKCAATTPSWEGERTNREEIIFLGFSTTKVPRARGISIRSSSWCFTSLCIYTHTYIYTETIHQQLFRSLLPTLFYHCISF